jgi:hypothetical protein
MPELRPRVFRSLAIAVAVATTVGNISIFSFAAERPRPLMRDFIGLNGHTVQFKPDLYAPVAKRVRDYHPVRWDLGEQTDSATKFPFAQNGVDWGSLYGKWKKAGFRIDACLMFDEVAPNQWNDLTQDAERYGEAFARAFGPSGAGGPALVEAVEIGNEPGKYSDDEYRRLFQAMATGLRRGDPQLRIATCAANLGLSGRYSKSVDSLTGLGALYDVVNIHVYAEVEPWPTWRRSRPEDPQTKFLENIQYVLTWRAQHAPDKEVWLTEFGWDASTKPPPATGTFSKWIGNSDTEQAQWIVRGWLLCAATALDRAYLYFFNDDDLPQVHGSSGLTRHFQPKPSFHAAAWLQRSLGDYRFSRAVREGASQWVFEFVRGDDPNDFVIAMWNSIGPDEPFAVPLANRRVSRAERMPLTSAPPKEAEVIVQGDTAVVQAGEQPVFLWLEQSKRGTQNAESDLDAACSVGS